MNLGGPGSFCRSGCRIGGSRAQTALKMFSHHVHYTFRFRILVSVRALDITARFGQRLSVSVTQSAFASTERSAALLSRRMRWCHRDHTPLITRVGYLPALSPCRPGESVMTLLTHSRLSLLGESYIKAPTATSNCMGVKADMPPVKVHN